MADTPQTSEMTGLPDRPSKCEWEVGKVGQSPHHHIGPAQRPKIFDNILDVTGCTPMVKLNRIPKEYGIKCEVVAKCEFFNPGGSLKDRAGNRMIKEAERENKIKPGGTFIEATSGNTGISIALACAVKGYKCVLTFPEKTSGEKELVMTALGAEVIRTPDDVRFNHPEAPISVAYRTQSERPGSFVLNQYTNLYNPLEHYDVTAEEIMEQCDGKIDMIILGVGTGGSISGIGRKFKEKLPDCKIIGVEPVGSVFSCPSNTQSDTGDKPAFFEIEGIGYDFVPTVLDRNIVDRWIQVSDKDSFVMARKLIKDEGLLCGGSSGSILFAAMEAAKDLSEKQRCVVLLGDGIRNYMTKYLTDSWMIERGYLDIDTEMREKHWWWDYRVEQINMRDAPLISMDINYEDIMSFLEKSGHQKLVVTDEDGIIKGTISTEAIMKRISEGKDLKDCTASDFLSTNYKKVTGTDSLARLYGLLLDFSYVIVVENRNSESDVNTNSKDRVLGIVTRKDLFKFISDESNKGK